MTPRRSGGIRTAVVLLLALIGLAGATAGTAGAAAARAATAATGPAPPRLSVTGAALIVANTGQVLYGLNQNAELPIASTTKLMTALVTLQHVDRLSTVFTQNDFVPASGDSQIGLVPGERMSVHDLLIALLLPSADDAAEDLAYNIGGGSVARFVELMNDEARRLGLTRTHYSTPIGLDAPGNYSSPLDLDRLGAFDMAHSTFLRRVVDLPSALLRSGRYPREVTNTDDLVGEYPWIKGIKTGHTDDAGYVLVSEGQRDGMTLIGSVLGTTSEAARDANALTLLDWGFDEFRPVDVVSRGEVLARPTVRDVSGRRAELVADGAYSSVLPKADRIRVRLDAPRQLTGPLPAHALLGRADVLIDGRTVARIPLELARALPAVSPVTQAARFLLRPSTLVWLVLVGGAGSLVMGRRRWRPRALAGRRMEEG